ncbi:MAG: hypothetical protein CR996_00695 [Draconibacterium sp.]|nr:MAG: hypothetical protein CR996_00695 [Draconibacterium sp.]PIF05228.1 MAG: hypothetical protein CSA36_07835 [Draconibacterium sp.]
MERFLEKSAAYIYEKHAGNLKDICIVFPNHRAGVFFTAYLQSLLEQATIGPEITTIGQFISGKSQPAEKLQLISVLYSVFKKHINTSETFDEFYFWGEILLADFNEIDRNLVNAKDLFRNVMELKDLDVLFDYLTIEQKEALGMFWSTVGSSGKNEFQQKHLAIWEKLYPVYVDFRKELKKRKLAYSGMVDRMVVENLENEPPVIPYKKVYIVGLNALTVCEERFFRYLQRQNKAAFLWDYDLFYLNDKVREAGMFIRKNIKHFPPPADFNLNVSQFQNPKEIQLVAVSSNLGQAQQIPAFLDRIGQSEKNFDTTAIVLADESLLNSALGAISPQWETVNVTMGYPVRNSVVYGFLMLLAALIKNVRRGKNGGDSVYYRYVAAILNHQIMAGWEDEKNKAFLQTAQLKNRININLSELDFSPLHKLIFTIPEHTSGYGAYFLKILAEIYHRMRDQAPENTIVSEVVINLYQAVEKLDNVVNQTIVDQEIELGDAVFFRLFSQYLGSISVAFEGEPLSGIQVMGVLETRCLDFKNLIILGFNESRWPRTSAPPSFIPYNIRRGFGLPGLDEQDAMFAYYFYRLIQRAENITATYSIVKEGIATGELSRYGYQLQYDSNHNPEQVNLTFRFANDPATPIVIQNSAEAALQLLNDNSPDHPLSPSAINTYLACSLRFWFKYVAKLPRPEEVLEDIDGAVFGNIFHNVAESVYKPFVGKTISDGDLEKILNDPVLLENEILKKVAVHYFGEKDGAKNTIVPEGKMALTIENLKTYLKQLFRIDKDVAPFQIVSLEKQYVFPLKINLPKGEKTIYIGGFVDRLDFANGNYRIIDYKTGNVMYTNFSSTEELFVRTPATAKKEILQALIYTWIYCQQTGIDNVTQGIYSLRNFFGNHFDPSLKYKRKVFSFSEISGEFEQHLVDLVAEIYSGKKPYEQTPHVKNCTYCAYHEICQRF